ncbi:MAG: WD40 repeat domain-containing protein [Chloroflexota bacterium]|nr:WD40 repeat domain-containing protein [Chloroflexota bacterium]
MKTRKFLSLIIVFLLSSLATADDQEPPFLWGSLDWSSDGRYLAVVTTGGVHIHNSDDLSLYKVLNEFVSSSIKWSNDGLRLAVGTDDPGRLIIWDLETEEETFLMTLPAVQHRRNFITSIQWSPRDTSLAAASYSGVYIWHFRTPGRVSGITFEGLLSIGFPRIHWRPGGFDIMSGSISNGIAIWNYYTGSLVDFIWNASFNSPARWSPDGNMIAAGRGPVTVWQVKPDVPHDAWDEIGGKRIHRLDYGFGSLQGLSWHPDSTKLAFVFLHGDSGYPPEQDFSRDGALIWDISANTTRLIPGVFIADVSHTDKVIEWSPDGSRLASISIDGRVVIWETSNYEIVAEYAGYRSLLDP